MLERVVDVSPEWMFKASTTPKQQMPWFSPKPCRTIGCEIDPRPGGKFFAQIHGPLQGSAGAVVLHLAAEVEQPSLRFAPSFILYFGKTIT